MAIRHQLASVGPLVLDEKHEADELTLNQFRPTQRRASLIIIWPQMVVLPVPRTPTRAMMAAERLTRDNTISNTLRCATICHSSARSRRGLRIGFIENSGHALPHEAKARQKDV